MMLYIDIIYMIHDFNDFAKNPVPLSTNECFKELHWVGVDFGASKVVKKHVLWDYEYTLFEPGLEPYQAPLGVGE